VLGRRLDRYIGLFFIWHFVLSLVGVVLLYVVIDTFAKLDDFIEQESVGAALRWIIVYHAYQVPPLLTQFLPLVTLLAGVISTARLARYNELNAIKAVGVSIHRALVPVFLCSIAIAALGAANQEFLVPSLARDIVDVRQMMSQKETFRDLSAFDRTHKLTVWVRQFEYRIPGFELLEVECRPTAPLPPGRKADTARFRSATGIWVRRWLFLFDGQALAPSGKWEPFPNKCLTTRDDATTFNMPRKPEAATKLRIAAERDGVPCEVTFRSHVHRKSLQLILGGQLSAPPSGPDTPAPIAIQAALWHGNQWRGRATTYYVREMGRDEAVYDGDPLPLAIPPQDLIKSEADPTLKSFRELARLKDTPPPLRQKILVALHGRVAFPLASVVLILVAIPLLFQTEGGKSTWVGMGLALLVSLAFYFINYVCQLAGQSPQGIFAGAPALAAWLPILLFATLGLFLMARMET